MKICFYSRMKQYTLTNGQKYLCLNWKDKLLYAHLMNLLNCINNGAHDNKIQLICVQDKFYYHTREEKECDRNRVRVGK